MTANLKNKYTFQKMEKAGVISKIFTTFFVFTLFTTNLLHAQLFYNNGAEIDAKPGALVFVDGSVQNQSGHITVEESAGTNAEFIIQNDFTNNDIAGGSGYYRVYGNWINNSIFNAGSGTVFLQGANQLLSGSVSTHFYNLTLDGSGLKTQTIDQYSTGILDLKHLELQTETFIFFVENVNTNAITRTTGFVSSLNGGFLSRETNSSSTYLFPVGSSLITPRYRPVEINPENVTANTYVVRMANVLATTEGYDVNAIPPKICEVNPQFYHQIDRTAGTAAIEISIFYDNAADGNWNGLANWTTPPDLWNLILASSISAGTPFHEATIPVWNTFSQIPYILYKIMPDATITDPGDFCSTDAAINLTAATAGGTWSGTGITDAVNGTFDPASAATGNNTITYTVGTGSCISTDNITITVNATPDATITDPGDFCSTDAAINLTAATTGGTWSGTGITDVVNGTFDPAAATIGNNTITYTVGTGSCISTDNITIQVSSTPDATITAAGPYCDNAAAINLTAATTGGTWSGTGITDATNGTFDPAVANTGSNSITYTVGTGSCISTDNIIITVNATPDATITDPGDFCSTDAAINLTATTAGGTWSGTGITDAVNGTFDPAAANTGNNTISYSVTSSGCTGTESIVIAVFNTPDATITDPGNMCSGDAAINLTAATAGGTWSGTGITNTTSGTFDPAAANTGSNSITYTVGTGSCISTDNITITVNATPDATITDPGDFCSTDAALNLTAATAGGTWSGTGITNITNGTFDPAAANTGNNTISYSVTSSGCTGTESIVIAVFDTPDATITAAGPYCDNAAAINLTAADAGGTWFGTGITNATNGTFDPAAAAIGNNVITYTVGTGSCISTDNITITVNATPDATITDPGDFCSTDAAINLTAATTGGTWSGTGITNITNGTFDPAAANTGNNTISYSVTSSGCTGAESIVIEVFDTPDATITDPGNMCSGDAAINLTAATAGGTWSGTGITNTTSGTFNPAAANIGSNSITYTVGTGSCISTDNITITVNTTPDATITDPGDFCSTDAALNLTAATAGGTWSGTGITNITNGTFDPAAANTGNNTISYSVTSSGCTGTESIVIAVFNTPDATIAAAGPYCDNVAAINLTAATTGGTWSGTGITNAANGTFDPAAANIGSNSITYTVGTGSCISEDSITITVNATPDAAITDPGDFCSTDAAITLTAATAGGTWSGTGITNITNGTFDPVAANTGNNTISYSVTSSGCTGTESIVIAVFNTPDATIAAAGPYCDNVAAINLTAATTGGTWSGTGITNTTNGTFDPAAANIGSNVITYTVGTGSCISEDSITITVNATPDAAITDPGDFCSTDAAINLTAATAGGTWSGTGITNITNGTFDPAAANTGNNTIYYSVTSSGCTGAESIVIEVFHTPDATITDPGSLCSGDVALNLSAADAGGTWSGTGITNTTNGTFDPAAANIGSNSITYTVGTGSCISEDSITITVNATPDAAIIPADPFCKGESPVNLTAVNTGGIWSGTGITDSDLGTFDPAIAEAGENIISYSLTNGMCTGTNQITILVSENADAGISGAGPFCYGDFEVELTANTSGGIWSGEGVSSDGIFNVGSAGAGTHTITYTIEGSCGSSGNIEITVYPSEMYSSYILQNPVCTGGDDGYIELSVSGGTQPYIYSWNTDTVLSSNILTEVSAGIYSVTITDAHGCFTDITDIIINDGSKECLTIPNAFTPNGDGINDEWVIENILSYPNYNIQVFNRWGQEIYNAFYGQPFWNGTYNGNPVPTGAYIYIIDLGDSSDNKVGIVTLIR